MTVVIRYESVLGPLVGLSLDADTDHIVIVPPGVYHAPVAIGGGRNVTIVCEGAQVIGSERPEGAA